MFTVEKSNSSESKSHSLGSALVKLTIPTFVENWRCICSARWWEHPSRGAICRHDSRCVPGAWQEGRNMNILASNKPTGSQTNHTTVANNALEWKLELDKLHSRCVGICPLTICIFEFWPGVPLDFETIGPSVAYSESPGCCSKFRKVEY